MRPAESPSHARTAEDDLGALRAAYLDAILTPEARSARRLVLDAAAAGTPVARLYLDVLRPALHEIGALWEQARIGVAQEHLATQITQSVLAELSLSLTGDASVGAGRSAIVSCSPGELHVLGGQMVADFLEADGWEVMLLGADVPAGEVAALAREHSVELVALSTALPAHLLAAGVVCAALRRLPEPPLIVAGGQAYRGDRRRALAVGADELAEDPEGLLRLLAARAAADGSLRG